MFTNYKPTNYDFLYSPCFTTQHDMANHFQLKISRSTWSVWASDAGGANFRDIGTVRQRRPTAHTGLSVVRARAVRADKFNSTDTMTYHWHALGFDGPVLPTDRGYEVPDALAKAT